LFASSFLRLFYFRRFWAGFAKRFNQAFNVNAFPKCLLTNRMLLVVMGAAQWDNTPIVWLLPHTCPAAKANMSALNRHILTAIDSAME
jgi:hypothetical protein